jgi:hypothetical protein
MAISAEEVFEAIARRPYASWMKRIEGRLRFDLTGGPATEHWMLTVGDGRLQLTREAAEADAAIETDLGVLIAMAAGETRPVPAFLRNDLRVKGSFRYVLLLDRLLPDGPEFRGEPGEPVEDTNG